MSYIALTISLTSLAFAAYSFFRYWTCPIVEYRPFPCDFNESGRRLLDIQDPVISYPSGEEIESFCIKHKELFGDTKRLPFIR